MNNLTDEKLTNLVNQKIRKSLIYEANDNIDAIPDNTIENPFKGEVVDTEFLNTSDFSTKYDEFENSLMNAINYNFVNKPIKYNEIITSYNSLCNYIKVSLKYDRLSNLKKNIIDYKMSELVDNIAIVRNISEVSDYATIYSNYLNQMIENINNKTYQRINVKFSETSKKELQNLMKLDEILYKTFKSYDRNKTPIKKRKLTELFTKYLKIYNKLKPILTSEDKIKLIISDKQLLNDIQVATENFMTEIIAEQPKEEPYIDRLPIMIDTGFTYPSDPYNELKKFYEDNPEYQSDYISVMEQSNNLKDAFLIPDLKERKRAISDLIKNYQSTKRKFTEKIKKMPVRTEEEIQLKKNEITYKEKIISILNSQQEYYQKQIRALDLIQKTQQDVLAQQDKIIREVEETKDETQTEQPKELEKSIIKLRIKTIDSIISELNSKIRTTDFEEEKLKMMDEIQAYEREKNNLEDELKASGKKKGKKQRKSKKVVKQPKMDKAGQRHRLAMKILKRLVK